MPPLANYLIGQPGIPLPPITANLYEYVLAGNGVFIRGARREFTVQFCIAPCDVRGLARLETQIEIRIPRVPAEQLRSMLHLAQHAQDSHGQPVEIIFHLLLDDGVNWRVVIPKQVQLPASAKPMDDSVGSSYAQALIEVHSHADMAAWFSTFDDYDETGCRVYAVLGRIFDRPEIRVRVGLHGYRCEIPTSLIFEMPPEMCDCVAAEEGQP
ncbi:MAG: hypothetical protein HY782_19960 [Chloroflexi bacterium]|nr:hypothetical protein [Chloroflexota bacterium]